MKIRTALLVAISVAGVPLPATADTSSVTLYGTLNVDLENVKREGATSGTTPLNSLVGTPGLTPANSPNRNRVSSNSSNIGFRGSENLGGGLQAIFQIESAVNVDAGGSNFATRDSFVGLSGGWGRLLLAGAHDTPYKRAVQGKDPFFVTGIATQKGILGSPGFNVISVGASSDTIAANTAGFDARMNNSVVYQSPNWSGLSFEAAYGANEGKTATRNPQAGSIRVAYENGPLWLTYAYEERKDIFGLTGIGAGNTGTSSKDTGNKVGVGYKFGSTDLLAVWEKLEYQNSGTVAGVTAFDRDAWLVSASHRFGNNRLSASYTRARDGNCALATGAACTTDGLGAKQYILGYAYSMSKRTELYAHYTMIDNDSAASYFFGVAGPASALPGGPGSDPQGLALGIRHRF